MIRHEIKEVFLKANKQEYRKFGITIGIVICLISAFLLWKTKGNAPYYLGVGIGFLFFGFIFPNTLKYVYMVWMGFAVVMGFVMSRLILSLLFFLLFTPVGIVTRFLAKDLLKENWDKDTKSYWIIRERKPYETQSAENQY
jgi:hypothetical protein